MRILLTQILCLQDSSVQVTFSNCPATTFIAIYTFNKPRSSSLLSPPVQVTLLSNTSFIRSMSSRKIPDSAHKVNSALRKLENYSYEEVYDEDDPDHPPSSIVVTPNFTRAKRKRIVSAKYQAYCQPTTTNNATTRSTKNNATTPSTTTTNNAMTMTPIINPMSTTPIINQTTTTPSINQRPTTPIINQTTTTTTINNATTIMNEGNALAKQKRQRAQEILVLDNLKSNSDKRNIIVSYDAFVDFMKSFVCLSCLTNNYTLTKLTRGIATSITSRCNCGQKAAIKAKIRSTAKSYEKYEANELPRLRPSDDYDLNICFMLALHSQGKGKRDAAAFAGMMNLALRPLSNCWEKMEEELCVSIIAMTTQIVEENLEEEIKLTEDKGSVTYHDGGKVGISVQGDARWDQRSSGHKYDSDSGTALICGNLSGKCVGLECMSRRCASCERKEAKQKNYSDFQKIPTLAESQYFKSKHPRHLCPRNYVGSSKGMEAKGAFKIVNRINTTTGAFILTYVMDDDSSTKAILRHGLAALVASGAMLDADWPLTEGGFRVNDTGLLPLDQHWLNFLGDKNHRVRTYARFIFHLSRLSAAKSKAHGGDAERLKRSFAYFLHQFSKRSWKRFVRSARAVLEHHFNCHKYCDKWCPAKTWNKEDKLKSALKYRDKIRDNDLYLQLKTHHDKFTTEEALREMYHEFHSNKCESLNGNITKYVPKNKHYCCTLSNKGRTHTAVGVDSVGYVQFYRRLFVILGVEELPTTTECHTDLDTGRIRKAAWDKTTERKRRRAEANTEKCLEGRQLTKRDNIKNFAYRRGMAGPQVDDPEEEDQTKRVATAPSICAYCDKKGHKTTKSKKCLFTSVLNSPFYRADNVERSTGKSPVHFVPWFSSKYQRTKRLTVSTTRCVAFYIPGNRGRGFSVF
jgi:hypothetical protein